MEEFIHLSPKKIESSFRTLIIIIPILFFVFITAFLLSRNPKNNQTAATVQLDTAVLGTQAESESK